MTIVTRRRTGEFTTVPNEIANDSALSFEARGLLIYLLAKPDNWQVQIKDIQREGQIGRDKAYKLLRELKDRGYIVADASRTDGKFASLNYTVYDCIEMATAIRVDTGFQDRLLKGTAKEISGLTRKEPLTDFQETVNSPHTDFPDTVNPNTAFPHTAEPDTEIPHAVKRIEDINNISPQTPRTSWGRGTRAGKAQAEALFEELWGGWPEDLLPDTKAIAVSRFKALNEDEQHRAVRHASAFVRVCTRKNRAALLIPYLTEKAFEDFAGGPAVNDRGYFVIERGTAEWDAWREWFQAHHGAETVRKLGSVASLERQSRFPEGFGPNEARK
ncbi:hypothetical protein ACRRRS_22045 (plasmid) [Brucella anthropi]|uniref:hypothetical protein n=1 Tax=Brucella anthropi TaxID=529 RepID=UPI003D7DDB1F